MRLALTFAVGALVLSCTSHLPAAQDAVPWAPSLEAAQAQAAREGRLVLVHFYSNDCPPCRKLEQNVFPRPEFGRAVASNYVPVKINADNYPKLAAKYGVDRWPTDVVVTPEGKPLTRPTVSPQDMNRYIASLNQVAAQHRVAPAAATAPPVHVASNPTAYPEREASYNQPMDPARASGSQPVTTHNPYAVRRDVAAAPRTSPATPSAQPWTQDTPYGYEREPRANTKRDPNIPPTQTTGPSGYSPSGYADKGGYGPADNQPSRDARRSSFQPAVPEGANAYVEGTPYAGGRVESPRNYADSPLPSRPTQSQAADSMYGPAGSSRAPVDAGVAGYDAGRAPTRPTETETRGYESRSAAAGPQVARDPAPRQEEIEPSRPVVQSNPHMRPAAPETAVAAPKHPPLGLDGYCPVALLSAGAWRKGDVRFGAIHRGRTYLFASAAEQQAFMADPDAYSPMLSGYDPVRFVESGELVEGKRKFGVTHDNKMYLFADETSRSRFEADPTAYAPTVRQAMEQSAGRTRR